MRTPRPIPAVAFCVILALSLSACPEEDSVGAEDVRGYVQGTVTINGEPAVEVTVTLSSGATTTTNSAGYYVFQDVAAGAYTVTISGYPGSVAFPATTQAAVISTSGQVAQVNFNGTTILSAPPLQ